MELEVRKKQSYEGQISSKKPKMKIGTILMGMMLVAIPVVITLFITMPDLWGMMVDAKSDILKGVAIGLSTLPVLMFIALKGGETWYKKAWTWIVGIITIGAVVVLSLAGTTSMESMQDMNDMDIQMDESL